MPNDGAKSADLIFSLARLWPNRQHESSWLKTLLCSLGLHRWHELDIGEIVQNDKAAFCRWCPKIRYRGELYE